MLTYGTVLGRRQEYPFYSEETDGDREHERALLHKLNEAKEELFKPYLDRIDKARCEKGVVMSSDVIDNGKDGDAKRWGVAYTVSGDMGKTTGRWPGDNDPVAQGTQSERRVRRSRCCCCCCCCCCCRVFACLSRPYSPIARRTADVPPKVVEG